MIIKISRGIFYAMYKVSDLGVYHFNNLFIEEVKLFNSIRLFQCGDLQCKKRTQILNHKQMCFEITYVVSGKGFCVINEKKLDLSEGTINITFKDEMHSITPDPVDPLRYFFLGIELLISHPLYNHLKEFQHKINDVTSRNQFDKFNIKDIFIRCLAEFEHPNLFSDVIIESTLNQIICYVFHNFEFNPYTYHRLYDSSELLIHSIVSYIDENIDKIFSVEDVFKEFSYSPSHISHTFSRMMNKTLITYINDCRMNKAISMIESKQYTMSKIAEKLGYSSIHTFSRAFKERFNVSPLYLSKNGRSTKEVDFSNDSVIGVIR